ncbi:unnamed protein product, partial [Allacma fusca]
FCKFDFQRTVR